MFTVLEATVPVFVHVIVMFVASTVIIPDCLFAPLNGLVVPNAVKPNSCVVEL